MNAAKNLCMAVVSSVSQYFAFFQTEPTAATAAKGVILTIALFAIGKAIDLLFQHYWKKREERRRPRQWDEE
jgi:hypothetical protein